MSEKIKIILTQEEVQIIWDLINSFCADMEESHEDYNIINKVEKRFGKIREKMLLQEPKK